MNIGKLKRSTQIAIMTGAGSGAVEKTESGTSPLTLSDSVVGNILGITINGRSVISAGSIVSVGDTGLTVTTANSDSTVTTSAEVITALPLRGVSATGRDKLSCTAESKQVETVYGSVRLADLTWNYNSNLKLFSTSLPTATIHQGKIKGDKCLCTKYVDINNYLTPFTNWNNFPNGYISCGCGYDYGGYINLALKDTEYDNVTDFVASLGDAELVYELAEHVTTPLTDAEISALSALSTYDPTTVISITDNPSITVKYMGKRAARTAPKKRTNRKKKS